MSVYRRKPNKVLAAQWLGTLTPELYEIIGHTSFDVRTEQVEVTWRESDPVRQFAPARTQLTLHLPGGDQEVFLGDYLVQEAVDGEVRAMREETFNVTHEKV